MVPSTFVKTAEQFHSMMDRMLAIRYFLIHGKTTSERLFAEILSSEAGKPDLLHFKITILLGESVEVLEQKLTLLDRSWDAEECSIRKVTSNWEKNYPWWMEWLQPESFVGTIGYGNDSFRKVKEDTSLFSFYHGFLLQVLRGYVELFDEQERKIRSHCLEHAPLRTMTRRFEAFVLQTRHTEVVRNIGLIQ